MGGRPAQVSALRKTAGRCRRGRGHQPRKVCSDAFARRKDRTILRPVWMVMDMPEQKPVCPKCGSTCIVEITNAKRCNQCGHQFDLEKDPIGRRARSEKVGYPQRGSVKP